jgi:hypothetical protein
MRTTAQDLMDQAPGTIARYLSDAQFYIDKEFGDGYAKEHPELVAMFIQACTKDYSATMMGNVISELSLTLSDGLEKISTAINDDTF